MRPDGLQVLGQDADAVVRNRDDAEEPIAESERGPHAGRNNEEQEGAIHP